MTLPQYTDGDLYTSLTVLLNDGTLDRWRSLGSMMLVSLEAYGAHPGSSDEQLAGDIRGLLDMDADVAVWRAFGGGVLKILDAWISPWTYHQHLQREGMRT